MKSKLLRHQRSKSTPSAVTGLTLLEVMVSLSILMVGMTIMVTLAIASLQRNTANKERLQATQLADEGVEVVKYIRDKDSSAFFTDTNFGAGGIYDAVTVPSAYRYIHYDTSTSDWIINSTNNIPTDETAIQGIFGRKINFSGFTSDGTNKQVTVTCTVTWTTKEARGITQTVTASTKLTNYK